RKTNRERASRGRLGSLRILFGDEGGVSRFLRRAATGADRQLLAPGTSKGYFNTGGRNRSRYYTMSVVDDTNGTLEEGPAAPRPITPEQRVEALRELNRGRTTLGFLWEWTEIFQVSILLFLLIRTFVVEAFKIPSGSMEHTLLVGDFLLVNKL